MKRIIAVILVLAVLFLFVGCKENTSSNAQNEESSKAQTGSENKQTETETKDLSDDELVRFAKIRLGVPEIQDITYKVGEKSYWEAGGKYLKQIDFYENGEIVAGASVDVTSGEPMRNIHTYDNGPLKSLSEALLQMIDGAYYEESKLSENCTTIGMQELAKKYTKKWEEIANEYYDKIMKCEETDETFYTTEEFHNSVANMKTSWEKYYKEQCESHAVVLRATYGPGTIVGPLAASYKYKLQKEWAIKLVEIYEQL